MNADQSPGVKRGGTVNIVTHAVEVVCSPEDIPESIDVDVSGLEINYSKHMSDVDPAAERAGWWAMSTRRWSPSCRRRATPKK